MSEAERRLLIPTRLSAAAEAGPEPAARLLELSGESMGTRWSVKLATARALAVEDLQSGLQAELDRVVAQMSHWREDSDLGRYNRAAAGSWQTLPADFAAVLREALAVAALSQGAYDPSAGALVDCWGFGPAPARRQAPAAAEIAAALRGVGWQRLRLDGERLYQPGGCRLDLSAIAKGYGVDLLARYLQARGLSHYLAEVGGELRGQGCKPDGSPWWVALESPDGTGSDLWLALDGVAIATSGDYRRYFEADGQRYPHSLDPRSGYPASGLASVSVLHSSCMSADALSTALTVLGWEPAQNFALRHNLATRFLRRRGAGFEEWLSPKLQALLE
ncbi:FAD:protein FMN transferase [Stagnimonas aquatica]|nr:FAD:protein FMN transferase [Stagnimonas aquatica]